MADSHRSKDPNNIRIYILQNILSGLLFVFVLGHVIVGQNFKAEYYSYLYAVPKTLFARLCIHAMLCLQNRPLAVRITFVQHLSFKLGSATHLCISMLDHGF